MGPRRREDERIACQVPLRARCSSWESFQDLFSGNLSRRGLFVPSERLAEAGEKVELQLLTPDGQPLHLIGVVVHVFTGDGNKARGLGVRLEAPRLDQEQLYQRLLDEAARQVRVQPAPGELDPAPVGDLRLPEIPSPPLGLFDSAPASPQRPSGQTGLFGPAPPADRPAVPPPTEQQRPVPATGLFGLPATEARPAAERETRPPKERPSGGAAWSGSDQDTPASMIAPKLPSSAPGPKGPPPPARPEAKPRTRPPSPPPRGRRQTPPPLEVKPPLPSPAAPEEEDSVLVRSEAGDDGEDRGVVVTPLGADGVGADDHPRPFALSAEADITAKLLAPLRARAQSAPTADPPEELIPLGETSWDEDTTKPAARDPSEEIPIFLENEASPAAPGVSPLAPLSEGPRAGAGGASPPTSQSLRQVLTGLKDLREKSSAPHLDDPRPAPTAQSLRAVTASVPPPAPAAPAARRGAVSPPPPTPPAVPPPSPHRPPAGEASSRPATTPPPPPPPAPSSIIAASRALAAQRSGPVLVGVDFGTSMSSLAVVMGGEVRVLKTPDGRCDVPSVVAFHQDQILIGNAARERLILDPANAIPSPKRLLGRQYDDRELEPYLATLAMRHSRGPYGEVLLQPPGRRLRVEEVCAPIFAYFRRLAEQQIGQPVREAVLTVPVSFDERRCRALGEAAALGGLQVLATVDEPTAAALTYASDPSYRGLVAVYDFGGGTFDFSVVDVSAADVQVVATAGDTWLGGDDFDEELAGAAANAFWRQHGIELRHQAVQWQRLRMAAEHTKRELSVREQSTLVLRNAALTSKGPVDLSLPVTRKSFAELSTPIIQRSLDTCREALVLCDINPRQLNAVYLSGGTCYVPAVREAVAGYFGKAPKVTVPPERAVVIGASIYAAQQLSARISC